MGRERRPRVAVPEQAVPLPPRQLACLQFLAEYQQQHHRFPTHREIAVSLQLQSTTAAIYLEPLRRKGLLARTPRAHRNWRITELGRRTLANDLAVSDAGSAGQPERLPDSLPNTAP